MAVQLQQPQGGNSDARTAFTLLLRGEGQPVVPEGMVVLNLADGARFELYMIPIHTPLREFQDYQIVFN